MCEDYQVPYFDMLPGDPSFDEVKKVVVTEKRRPLVPNRWYRDEVSGTFWSLGGSDAATCQEGTLSGIYAVLVGVVSWLAD